MCAFLHTQIKSAFNFRVYFIHDNFSLGIGMIAAHAAGSRQPHALHHASTGTLSLMRGIRNASALPLSASPEPKFADANLASSSLSMPLPRRVDRSWST